MPRYSGIIRYITPSGEEKVVRLNIEAPPDRTLEDLIREVEEAYSLRLPPGSKILEIYLEPAQEKTKSGGLLASLEIKKLKHRPNLYKVKLSLPYVKSESRTVVDVDVVLRSPDGRRERLKIEETFRFKVPQSLLVKLKRIVEEALLTRSLSPRALIELAYYVESGAEQRFINKLLMNLEKRGQIASTVMPLLHDLAAELLAEPYERRIDLTGFLVRLGRELTKARSLMDAGYSPERVNINFAEETVRLNERRIIVGGEPLTHQEEIARTFKIELPPQLLFRFLEQVLAGTSPANIRNIVKAGEKVSLTFATSPALLPMLRETVEHFLKKLQSLNELRRELFYLYTEQQLLKKNNIPRMLTCARKIAQLVENIASELSNLFSEVTSIGEPDLREMVMSQLSRSLEALGDILPELRYIESVSEEKKPEAIIEHIPELMTKMKTTPQLRIPALTLGYILLETKLAKAPPKFHIFLSQARTRQDIEKIVSLIEALASLGLKPKLEIVIQLAERARQVGAPELLRRLRFLGLPREMLESNPNREGEYVTA